MPEDCRSRYFSTDYAHWDNDNRDKVLASLPPARSIGDAYVPSLTWVGRRRGYEARLISGLS